MQEKEANTHTLSHTHTGKVPVEPRKTKRSENEQIKTE